MTLWTLRTFDFITKLCRPIGQHYQYSKLCLFCQYQAIILTACKFLRYFVTQSLTKHYFKDIIAYYNN